MYIKRFYSDASECSPQCWAAASQVRAVDQQVLVQAFSSGHDIYGTISDQGPLFCISAHNYFAHLLYKFSKQVKPNKQSMWIIYVYAYHVCEFW